MDKEIKEKLHIEKVVNTGRLYPMKEACEQTGLAYETLKFYCNIGLVPGVKRDARNRRVFNDKDISWIKSLTCLKNCDMSIEEMKEYLALCLKGQSTIPERKEMLMKKRAILIKKHSEIQAAIDAAEAGSTVTLTITDSTGLVVRTLPTPAALDGSLRRLSWDGLDDAGNPAPKGTYTWTLIAFAVDTSSQVVNVTGTGAATGTIKRG